MNPEKPLWMLLCVLFLQSHLSAQDKDKLNIKFGKVKPEDFDLSGRHFDSTASAVVIADVGSSSFMANTKGWFSLEFTHFKRAKVLNKNGFGIATVEIPLYVDGNNVEKIVNLKAYTYNIENGKVVETKLEDKNIFTDKINTHLLIRKFVFPALKEGSIIEYSYTQQSDFLFNLQPWEFQGEYPELWSEYEVNIPEYFNYVFLGQGYQPYFVNKSSSTNVHYAINVAEKTERSDYYQLDGTAIDHRWVMKDVPALKEERFTSTIKNYISKIEFQLSQYKFPNTAPKDVMGNWVTVNEKLIESEDFGASVYKNNGWMDNEMPAIIGKATTPMEKAKNIYSYVKDNFTCTEYSRVYTTNPLKTVFKNKNGSEAELNLLLTALLNHAGIYADPVILSTRTHGYAHQIYPLMDRFNYVICAADVDNTVYYLDASRAGLGFGILPGYCYNGYARVIDKQNPRPVSFEPDSLMERKLTSVYIINDEKPKGMLTGSVETTPGLMESYTLRENINKKGEKSFAANIQSGYPAEMKIENTRIDSLRHYDCPITIHYDFSFKSGGEEDLIYFNPLMTEGYKENPLKAAERQYPVEMPSAKEETYVLTMETPQGYEIDELPKSVRIKLNETDGFYEYLIGKTEDGLQFRSHLKINKANFSPEDYNTLRDFFTMIVKKQSEQIVFKKKK